MPAFEDLDWHRLDIGAIVEGRGIATVDDVGLGHAQRWLQAHCYAISAIDFSAGIGPALTEISKIFDWKRNFGYELDPSSRNLDALRDGITSHEAPANGHALTLLSFERAWEEDQYWSQSLLSMLSELSLRELAVGRRLFSVIRGSSLAGLPFEQLAIPYPRVRTSEA